MKLTQAIPLISLKTIDDFPELQRLSFLSPHLFLQSLLPPSGTGVVEQRHSVS
jgi:hypothetical protein